MTGNKMKAADVEQLCRLAIHGIKGNQTLEMFPIKISRSRACSSARF